MEVGRILNVTRDDWSSPAEFVGYVEVEEGCFRLGTQCLSRQHFTLFHAGTRSLGTKTFGLRRSRDTAPNRHLTMKLIFCTIDHFHRSGTFAFASG